MMYSEADEKNIASRLRKYWVLTAIGTAALIGVYVLSMIIRSQPLAYIAGAVLFTFFLFMVLEYIVPCIRYKHFLEDIHNGLSRRIAGEVVEISDKEELQDGVRVLPVRIFLPDEQDEHIVYLNADKRDRFPNVGATVQLKCQGRHVLGLE